MELPWVRLDFAKTRFVWVRYSFRTTSSRRRRVGKSCVRRGQVENGPSGLDFNLLPNKLIDSSMAMPNPYLQILSCLPEYENREQEIMLGYTGHFCTFVVKDDSEGPVLCAAVYSSSDNSNNNKFNLRF